MNDATKAHVDEEHPIIRDDPPPTTKTIIMDQQHDTDSASVKLYEVISGGLSCFLIVFSAWIGDAFAAAAWLCVLILIIKDWLRADRS